MSRPPMREPRPLPLWQAFLIALLLHALAGALLWGPGSTFASWVALSEEELRALEALEGPQEEPLRFEFVDILDEPEVDNPEARVGSDRARRARAERRQADAPDPDNPDPYALGSTYQKVQVAPPPAPERPPGSAAAGRPGPAEGEGTAAGAAASPSAPPAPPPGGGAPGARPGAPGDLLRSMPRVTAGDLAESFHNPTGQSESEIGSISFDTAVIDWGPYERIVIRELRRRIWERLPVAVLSGLRGAVVVSFRIARDGSISQVALIDSFGVRQGSAGNVEVTAGIRPLETTSTGAVEAMELPPLPDLPSSYSEPDVGLTIAIYYNLRPPRR